MGIVGGILFLYLIWRNLRDDYPEDSLIAFSWLGLAVFGLSGRLAFGLINWGIWSDSWFKWVNFVGEKGFVEGVGLVGMVLVSYVFSLSNNWKVWAFMEDVAGMIYIFMAFLFVGRFWSEKTNWNLLALVGVMVAGFLVGEYFKGKYRSYAWYKSGKKGFAFFGANIIVGILMWFWSYFGLQQGLAWSALYLGLSLVSLMGLIYLADIINKK